MMPERQAFLQRRKTSGFTVDNGDVRMLNIAGDLSGLVRVESLRITGDGDEMS